LVDALVDGVAVSINSIFLASDALRDNGLGFVGDEAINRVVRIGNEIKATRLELLNPISSTSNWLYVFF
jgi:hypothetical protein